jgi:hypothetical protein
MCVFLLSFYHTNANSILQVDRKTLLTTGGRTCVSREICSARAQFARVYEWIEAEGTNLGKVVCCECCASAKL